MNKMHFHWQRFTSKINSQVLSKIKIVALFPVILYGISFSPLMLSAQDCSLTLTAKNNIESVNDEGRIYFISLQNNTNKEITVALSVSNTRAEKNPDKSSTHDNAVLNALITDSEGKLIHGNINLAPKQLLEFQVKVTVPDGTPINRWNNLLLQASSEKCNNYSASLILYTYIPNPLEK